MSRSVQHGQRLNPGNTMPLHTSSHQAMYLPSINFKQLMVSEIEHIQNLSFRKCPSTQPANMGKNYLHNHLMCQLSCTALHWSSKHAPISTHVLCLYLVLISLLLQIKLSVKFAILKDNCGLNFREIQQQTVRDESCFKR